ncbi:putative ATP-dependent RNA helicase TDRD12 [Ceratina calcarata]|uniref:RNA helicase n=1 Tax=Ceratina calcarata TaxID=156304 RepID=A0AAJ7IVP5_9HYME|nr:putative ATP-dependent RNA helicase TDRD12 [Ceratina calcarata]
MFEAVTIMIPYSAVLVKVTNVLTPYIMRIMYDTKYNDERLDFIAEKLIAKEIIFNNDTNDIEPKVGDAVIVHSKFNKRIFIPSRLCRGYISSIKDSRKLYNVMLSDYGVCIRARRDDFFLCPDDLISEEHFSFTVGLYNVLPVSAKNGSLANNKVSSVSKGWCLPAIEYTRNLISASAVIYYHRLAFDEHGKSYGEFYLTIKDRVISLSKALVSNHYAIYLDEALQTIEGPMSNGKLDVEIFNDETDLSKIPSNNLKEENKSKPVVRKETHLHHVSHKFVGHEEHVFLCGREDCKKLNSVVDAEFPTSIHMTWNKSMKSSKPKKMQSFIWPAIKEGVSVAAIGPPKSGKTLGYAFPISGCLAADSELPQGLKPSAVILCSSSQQVIEVYFLFKTFLEKYKKIKIVTAVNNKSYRSIAAEIYNGCQILISTPSVLGRFMNNNKAMLDFKYLRYLVFDSADVILDKYFNSVSRLFAKHNILCNRESGKLQLIITATNCTTQLKKFISALMKDPLICITSCLEAALFKSVSMNVCVVNSEKKNEKLLDLLGNKYLQSRTAVICRSSKEAESLRRLLSKRVETLIATENTNMFGLNEIKTYWNGCVIGSYPLLVCTDSVLSDLNITNVTNLIHYSIPSTSKTSFCFRFSVLLDNLRTESGICKVNILFDESNDVQYIYIVRMMRRVNITVPDNMLKTVELVAAALETKKRNHPICNQIKYWGFCDKQSFCEFRHKIIKCIDDPITDIQMDDEVKFRLINIHSPIHFSVRIVSYIKKATKDEIQFSNIEYMQITFKLQRFYSSSENRKTCEVINVGSIYGLEEPVGTFNRVQIIRIAKYETENPKCVDVRCLDSGLLLQNILVSKLLQMPEKLANYPVHTVELFLTGIIPPDNEYVWNNHSFDYVYQWFKEHVDDDSYIIGTVKLHLGHTMWMETLKVGTKVIGYKDLIGSSLRAELLRQNHAVENTKHINQLYKMCRDGGYSEINGRNLDTLLIEERVCP